MCIILKEFDGEEKVEEGKLKQLNIFYIKIRIKQRRK